MKGWWKAFNATGDIYATLYSISYIVRFSERKSGALPSIYCVPNTTHKYGSYGSTDT